MLLNKGGTIINKEKIFKDILDSAFEVHTELGPGLLESVYMHCLAREIERKGYSVEVEKEIPIVYKGVKIGKSFRADIVVEKIILIELKAVNMLLDIHLAQILTYMKMTNINLGLLANFNRVRLKDGIKRVVR